jgi:hypothetical protein
MPVSLLIFGTVPFFYLAQLFLTDRENLDCFSFNWQEFRFEAGSRTYKAINTKFTYS